MSAAIVEIETRSGDQAKSATASSCAGSCTYTWTAGGYVYKSGSCSGTGSCPQSCPTNHDARIESASP